MKYSDFEAHVCVEGQYLDEYQVSNEGENALMCWIASEEGKEFIIKGTNATASTEFRYQVEVDGQIMDSLLVRPGTSSMSTGAVVSPTSVRPFAFSRLNVADDDALLRRDLKKLEAIGTIRITVQRVIIKSVGSYTTFKSEAGDVGLVHERSKKAGVHCVSLGKEKQVAPMTTIGVTYVDTPEKPYCVFVFRYRPKGILQAQGIIALAARNSPQQSSPPTGSSQDGVQPIAPAQPKASGSRKRSRDGFQAASKNLDVKKESDDEDEDADALQAQLDAIQARLSKVKAKKNHKRVKREPAPIQLDASGDIIDLTSD